MDQKVLDTFKSQLEEKRDEILRDAERTLTELNEQGGNIPDPNDRARSATRAGKGDYVRRQGYRFNE